MTWSSVAFDRGLRGEVHLDILRAGGHRQPLPVRAWTGGTGPADECLIAGCAGPTLDVGCGPGRMTEALTRRGTAALGIDISATAVALTRRRGAAALRRDVFAPLPATGRWEHILLADGNVGIGGDPQRLLHRCRELLAANGTVVVDLEPPGTGLVVEQIRLAAGDRCSRPFRWCWVGADVVQRVAATARLRVEDIWCADGRWQARLGRTR